MEPCGSVNGTAGLFVVDERKLEETTVGNGTDSVMMIDFLVGKHVVHVYNRAFCHGIGFCPGSPAACPAEGTDMAVMTVFLSLKGPES